jgi:hypothetical protein
VLPAAAGASQCTASGSGLDGAVAVNSGERAERVGGVTLSWGVDSHHHPPNHNQAVTGRRFCVFCKRDWFFVFLSFFFSSFSFVAHNI